MNRMTLTEFWKWGMFMEKRQFDIYFAEYIKNHKKDGFDLFHLTNEAIQYAITKTKTYEFGDTVLIVRPEKQVRKEARNIQRIQPTDNETSIQTQFSHSLEEITCAMGRTGR